MECVRVLHGPVQHAAGRERACEFFNCCGRSGDDAETRAVDQRERQAAWKQRLEFGFRQCHREHFCGRELRDELRPPHDQAQCIFERKDARQAGRDILAHAVPDDGLRDDAEIDPQPRKRVFDREKRGLQMDALVESASVFVLGRLCIAREHFFQINALSRRGFLPVAMFRIQDVADVEAEMRTEDFRAAIHLAAEDREGRAKLAAHADVVIADAGEKQDDRAFRSFVHAGGGKARRLRCERGDGTGAIRRDDEAAVRHRAAASLQSECRVVQIHRRIAFQKCAEIFGGSRERRLGARREHEKFWPLRFAHGRDRRCFFEDDVGIRPAHAGGHDACAARAAGSDPRSQACVHEERRRREINLRI